MSSKYMETISNLVDTYSPMCNEHLKKKIVNLLYRCFPPFGISNDSTPCSAKADAVILRVVITDTFELPDILVAFNVLEDNLDIKVDSNNIMYVIISDAKRDPK